jgi:acetyltransferase-like isoleucine patch superfamily enzyme
MDNSYCSHEELSSIGFRKIGENVLISRFARFYGAENIELGHDVRIDDFCILSGQITLGSHIHISAYCGLYGGYGIEMEDYTGLSARCLLFSATDDFSGNYLVGTMANKEYRNVKGGKITLKKYCQLGCNTIVFPAVMLNEGVAVGAMSLVLRDLEPWKIYAGIPAKYLKERSKNLLQFIR